MNDIEYRLLYDLKQSRIAKLRSQLVKIDKLRTRCNAKQLKELHAIELKIELALSQTKSADCITVLNDLDLYSL